jgi:vacuolar-type H+-ATPase subunit E/Vma4
MAIKTIEDGWDCVPELKECVAEIDNVNSIIYEINNCVRQTDLYTIVEELKNMVYNLTEKLEAIDEDQEFETVNEIE